MSESLEWKMANKERVKVGEREREREREWQQKLHNSQLAREYYSLSQRQLFPELQSELCVAEEKSQRSQIL